MNRSELDLFLRSCRKEDFLSVLSTSGLNELFPGISDLIGCDQGKENHSEGDVALHTWMVLDAMKCICREGLRREPDFIELLAALMHDWRKPETRTLNSDGSVSFPGHEALAGAEVSRVGAVLGLDENEKAHLFSLVAYHGDITCFPHLSDTKKRALLVSPYLKSLCAFQKADATSAHRPDGGHWPVYWTEIEAALRL